LIPFASRNEFTIQREEIHIMDAQSIIAALDAEIEALQQARAVLLNSDQAGARRGSAKPKKVAKRVLSPEARKRIADAQRKRWAATRKTKRTAAAPAKAAKKSARKKKPAKKSVPGKAKKAVTKKAAAKSEPPKTEAVPF
jgi:hypothetical protein